MHGVVCLLLLVLVFCSVLSRFVLFWFWATRKGYEVRVLWSKSRYVKCICFLWMLVTFMLSWKSISVYCPIFFVSWEGNNMCKQNWPTASRNFVYANYNGIFMKLTVLKLKLKPETFWSCLKYIMMYNNRLWLAICSHDHLRFFLMI